MKHIKTYENNYKINGEHSYYILDNELFIMVAEIFGEGDFLCYTKILYQYEKATKKISKKDSRYKSFQASKTTIEELIVYKSDDLQECIDKLPLIDSTNKYNL